MTDIDWSKAPEGATHVNGAGVFQRENKDGSVSEHDEGCWRMTSKRIADFNPNYIKARPITWTGDGLPPVGIKVEFLGFHDGVEQWKQGRVIAHDNGFAVLGYLTANYFAIDADKVRPIRIPEQIAEEEREKVIRDMAEIAKARTGFGVNLADFEALYDAGYRKQEAV